MHARHAAIGVIGLRIFLVTFHKKIAKKIIKPNGFKHKIPQENKKAEYDAGHPPHFWGGAPSLLLHALQIN